MQPMKKRLNGFEIRKKNKRERELNRFISLCCRLYSK